MRLTILGKSVAWQDANQACSGYLVEVDGYTLLLDCGIGVFSKLRQYRRFESVDAVVISHMHPDHCFDLIPFSYALLYGAHPDFSRMAPDPDPPMISPSLYLPPEGSENLRKIASVWGHEQLVDTAFSTSDYDPDTVLELGPFNLRFCFVPHFIPTYAVEVVEKATSKRMVFSADLAPSQAFIKFAHKADLLLIEATLTEPEIHGDRGHLTVAEAVEHAQAAAVKRAILTHISRDLDFLMVSQIAGDSALPISVAYEGAAYDL